MKLSILLISILSFVACGGKKTEGESQPAAAAATPAAGTAQMTGEQLFNEKGCVTCHGAQGKGDGPVGASLKPKPRNFSDAKWKYGFDTATIVKTLTNGSPGTSMAPYKGILTEAEMNLLAEHVRKLGGKT